MRSHLSCQVQCSMKRSVVGSGPPSAMRIMELCARTRRSAVGKGRVWQSKLLVSAPYLLEPLQLFRRG